MPSRSVPPRGGFARVGRRDGLLLLLLLLDLLLGDLLLLLLLLDLLLGGRLLLLLLLNLLLGDRLLLLLLRLLLLLLLLGLLLGDRRLLLLLIVIVIATAHQGESGCADAGARARVEQSSAAQPLRANLVPVFIAHGEPRPSVANLRCTVGKVAGSSAPSGRF